MWDIILEILERKASQGLDVRIMYDDMGCFLRLPKDYPEKLKEKGIKCTVFGLFRPVLSARQNNRNHRKIAVIDGRTAFTGGINLADEYINAKERFGHWKDTAVMVEGEAAWCFTLMFMQMWSVSSNSSKFDVQNELIKYNPWNQNTLLEINTESFVQPYSDSPMADERVGKNVYLHIIHSAARYVYINTPYLIIDDVLISELCLAAKSGVDVRILTPHQPDKKYVHTVTRSFYRELINAGVRVYEYVDGFLHAKSFVSDDRVAAVGTANLDYRSLYLHFECGVCIYDKKVIADIRDDFINTLERCVEVTVESIESSVLGRFYQDTLRLFSPLL
jgi:cardiolipin synthase